MMQEDAHDHGAEQALGALVVPAEGGPHLDVELPNPHGNEAELAASGDQLNANPPPQAGGHGGIVFNADGTLTKPTNATESAFYQAHANDDDLQGLIPQYHGDDNGNITLSNLTHGMQDPQVMDVKIGPKTVSYGELRESGMGRAASWLKKRKLRAADWYTKSSSRGFRLVSDPTGPDGRSRSEIAREHPEDAFDRFLPADQEQQTAAAQIRAIRAAFADKNLAFVGASILIARDAHGVRVNLIDFAHAMEANGDAEHDARVEKYKDRFLAGLDSLADRLDPQDQNPDVGLVDEDE